MPRKMFDNLMSASCHSRPLVDCLFAPYQGVEIIQGSVARVKTQGREDDMTSNVTVFSYV